MVENAAAKQRRRGRGRPFEPGQSGNPAGKRKGTRHRITMLAEELFEGEAEGLIRKAIERALAGDTTALRLCLERIVPPRRDRPVRFRLPTLSTAGDAVTAIAAIVNAVAAGKLTPSEASEFSALVGTLAKTIEIAELDNRVHALEKTILAKEP